MPKEGAFHHLIIVSYPRQDKRSKGNGSTIQHNFMLLTVSLDLSSEFPNQVMSLKAVFSEDLTKLNSIKDLSNVLMIQKKFAAPSLPDVCIAVLLFMTLPVTSGMAETSFSKLKVIKNYLRCTMSKERLSYLSLISIEQQEARKIELYELITDFAKKNVRRHSLSL
ncbi:uncharacterized protein TNCV_742651 [Trichonephila clavipes]|nr:uncharacterized protein TNCV_742651 [Trichonephila clavipes]